MVVWVILQVIANRRDLVQGSLESMERVLLGVVVTRLIKSTCHSWLSWEKVLLHQLQLEQQVVDRVGLLVVASLTGPGLLLL